MRRVGDSGMRKHENTVATSSAWNTSMVACWPYMAGRTNWQGSTSLESLLLRALPYAAARVSTQSWCTKLRQESVRATQRQAQIGRETPASHAPQRRLPLHQVCEARESHAKQVQQRRGHSQRQWRVICLIKRHPEGWELRFPHLDVCQAVE